MKIVFEPVPERGPVSNYDIVRRFDVYNMAEFLAQVSDVTTKKRRGYQQSQNSGVAAEPVCQEGAG